MAEVDRAGNSDNFNFNSHHFCKSARSTRRQCEKKMKCLHDAGSAIYIYCKILGVRLPVCPVIKNKILMLIKV